MRIRKRTVSETETHRVLTMRGHSIFAWCGGCEQGVEMVAVECAEKFLGPGVPSPREHIAKSGHFAVTKDKKLWVCHRWLSRPV
jgi:hypothetical protein